MNCQVKKLMSEYNINLSNDEVLYSHLWVPHKDGKSEVSFVCKKCGMKCTFNKRLLENNLGQTTTFTGVSCEEHMMKEALE